MTDPVAIATALKAIAAALPGVKEAHLGALVAVSASPVAEILLEDGNLAQLPAGGPGETLERHSLVVLFLVRVTPNSEADETTIGTLVTGLINTINAAGFDDTLGGIAERTRATAYRLTMTSRNERAYRAGAVRIEAGEL